MNERRLPIGAEPTPAGTHFRVWAPRCRRVEVVLSSGSHALRSEPGGYFSGLAQATPGTRYHYRLDGAEKLYPDPASRSQPDGPHGPSVVVDPSAFAWTDDAWRGAGARGQVIYELHVGTFTPEGTWEAAARELPELAALGVTMIEVMPVADFAGTFGWGYDGVNLFAPTRLYGTPDDFRRFVDRAHGLGVAVILDVVYNHFGPDGNYLGSFSQHYTTDKHKTDWGEAINYYDDDSAPVREFFLANVEHWIDEYRLDGLRLDATQNIYDESPDHIVKAITRKVRACGKKRGKQTFVVAENEPQDTTLVRPVDKGGAGMDAMWNDDYHHSAVVALTGHNQAYFTDYMGEPQEFISSIKYGFLYQGQRYKWQKQRRGGPSLDLDPTCFVYFLENHDQVANSGRGHRLSVHSSPGRMRALTALLLLGPGTPMLFQGQEFASSKDFHYFADLGPDLSPLVHSGRKESLAQFPNMATPLMQGHIPDPSDPRTFARCKLDLSERESHHETYALHRDLLRLRRVEPAFHQQRPRNVDGAVLSHDAFVLRFFGLEGDDRLVLVNLQRDLHLDPAPEPLLAPPAGMRWELLWSSEDYAYGGLGTPEPDGELNWRLPGESAIVMRPVPFIEVQGSSEIV
jgi:maltooligosyltrehalose trehalohydrolase